MWKITIFNLFYLLIISLICFVNGSIINNDIERTIDISSQLAKESIKIFAENLAGKPITQYAFVVNSDDRDNLSFISAKDGAKKSLKMEEKLENNLVYILFTFPSPSPTQTINIETVFTKQISPYPLEIRQSEKQLLKYVGFLNLYSPYTTKIQRTTIKLPGSNILSYSQYKPVSTSSSSIKYGPYENVEPFSNQTMAIHYENQSPVLTVNFLERTIEVSHWGNIAVKENIFLTHTGAKLKGSFSRYEYQKDARSGQSAIKSYKTILPASATGVYYRDSNGNISTSNMNILRDSVELELRPRFPLFGGWKTNYILGYNVPSFEYLYTKNQNYLLRMRVIDHIFDDMIVEKAVIKIILPEGSSSLKLLTPYTVSRNPDELVYTYLDTVGRPVISFTKSNLVENHISDFELQYEFNKLSLLIEPLLVISFIYVIFIFTILLLRLDFSINPHAHKD